jgi:hypothetical protein
MITTDASWAILNSSRLCSPIICVESNVGFIIVTPKMASIGATDQTKTSSGRLARNPLNEFGLLLDIEVQK